ncbi:hypothetical protein GO001_33295 [Streptomyces sp. NRRL B-1677]|uniref:hypothetical protein n=1 Tax=Streptomyces sp. NRRL B-1677 TaxID=2682966 RepID=UPI001892B4CB|nr:hypothetical protein [Streptomyces sp. NRRL B-1677]MBF6050003.1 hypothetical protein [Streptomyces sp. NRRL B-1677]
MRGRGKARGGVVGVTVLGLLMAVTARAGAAGEAGALTGYAMAPGAQVIEGALARDGGPLLKPGPHTYKDSVRPGERKHYTVELDGTSNAYVSAVAAPKPGSAMGPRDGIDVALETLDGTSCGGGRHRTFLSAGGAYPVADYAERAPRPGSACAAAGTYRFVLERGDAAGGDGAAVPVEIQYVTAPPGEEGAGGSGGPGGLGRSGGQGGPSSSGGSWASQAPRMPDGPGKAVTGGSGFNDAAEVGAGSWKDELRPGETHFYRVAVTAGRQLFARARFGAAPSGGATPYVSGGVRLGLNNTARGYVMNRTTGYQGKPAAVSLATPPAAYGGGVAVGDAVRGMRFAGWYYLQASLSPRAGAGVGAGVASAAVPVTLDVDVAAAREAAPASKPVSGVVPSGGEGRDGALRVVGYAGVGTGSALLAGLAGWTLVARRRARRHGG